MVELRKRKTPPPAVEKPAKAAKKKAAAPKARPAAAVASKATAAVDIKKSSEPKNSPGKPAVGDTVDLDGFGGEVTLEDGASTTLSKLLDASKAGVVLFTYPKASTPGCTTQACLFRDDYDSLTSTGLDIFGLSADSTKANSSFKAKYGFPYPLLCDPQRTLIDAIGLKKAPSGTQRGVFVVDKKGKVLVADAGGPAATVDTVRGLVAASAV